MVKHLPTLEYVLCELRLIGLDAVSNIDDAANFREDTLKRFLRLLRNEPILKMTQVPLELIRLITHLCESSMELLFKQKMLKLIKFFSEEAEPIDVLQTLSLCTRTSLSDISVEVFPILQTILQRGAFEAKTCELSISRLRLKRARNYFGNSITSESEKLNEDLDANHIWRSMANGILSIEK